MDEIERLTLMDAPQCDGVYDFPTWRLSRPPGRLAMSMTSHSPDAAFRTPRP